MASPAWIVVFCLASLATPAFASNEIYRYTDDSGTLNFTTELYQIPQKYRDQAVPLKLGVSPPVSTSSLQPMVRVVRSAGEYRMSDHDTLMDATRLAIDYAKRQVLEEVAIYLEGTTEVKNLDVTREEIRTYTAGIVTVLDQQIRTRLEGGEIVIHVDLTAQADEHEVIEAIASLRENELAKQELISLRIKTDQLRQQLDIANQALAKANTSERVQALTIQRQDLLNRIQAETETTVPSSLARLRRFLSGPLR